MELSSTQKGALAENIVSNELMIETKGRLSPFKPMADDDGIDVLIYDKLTIRSVPLQIRSSTNTIKKRGKQERSNTAYFELKKSALKKERKAFLLCVLLKQNMKTAERAWLFPLDQLHKIASKGKDKYIIRANKQLSTKDKFKNYQCESIKEVAKRLIKYFEEKST
ncbi:hypothetical protein BMS3Abin15_01181 [bacterium BMS3Abin15]|nr:hypothetical protein BMS3Abin15_01181 [bacterium BMS3Abin15]